jgi:ATP-dependent helicase HrpB
MSSFPHSVEFEESYAAGGQETANAIARILFKGPALPIDQSLAQLEQTLERTRTAIVAAPPGAGKTTRVPAALAAAGWASGRKVLVVEPRRLAARAAARHMAALAGEDPGGLVGITVRFATETSARTRIEFLTDGVFTRRILDDPLLHGVAAVVLDEFHERSLDTDLGFALARDVQQGLREDLRLVLMSATLDVDKLTRLCPDAEVIASAGRAFPVVTRHLPRDRSAPIEREVAAAVRRALASDPGSALVFLPGMREIRRTQALVEDMLPGEDVAVLPLHGSLAREAQDAAIAPAPPGRRKVVLATSIAETSLTIEGVTIVVDSGLKRAPRFDPQSGLTRLETVRVSRAAADQRQGRAGRTASGVCWRLWDERETAALPAFDRPEILSADLAPLALALADWGADDTALAFPDPPPAAVLRSARSALERLGAIDAAGRLTDRGRALRRLPFDPRIARMLLDAAAANAVSLAAEIAAVLSEPGIGGDSTMLEERIEEFRRERSARAAALRTLARRWADEAARLSRRDSAPRFAGEATPGLLLALAFPDRVAQRRTNRAGAFLMANGGAAMVDPADPLAREPFIAIAETAGAADQARVLLAAPISREDIERALGEDIETREETTFDPESMSLRRRRVRRFGALVLSEKPQPVAGDDGQAQQLATAIATTCFDRLPWSGPARQFLDRVRFMRRVEGEAWPDVSQENLAATAHDWLAPALRGRNSLAEITPSALAAALATRLAPAQHARLDVQAPTHVRTPAGARIAIDYGGDDGPGFAGKLQALFGLDVHPAVAAGRVPLLVALLSPAGRPVQVTRDLPGFWRGSYAAVRKEMRGRYPRHAWPEDPLQPSPTPAPRRS